MVQKTDRPVIPDPVKEKIAELQEEKDYATAGETIRGVFIEAGYDV